MALHFSHSDPSSTLHLSQKAPVLLAAAAPASRIFPLTLLEKPETPATWADYERLFQACLRAGDDRSAHLCLERLTLRFGASDTRVMGLRGMYQEAIATSTADLEKVLRSYENILQADAMNVVCESQLGTEFNLTDICSQYSKEGLPSRSPYRGHRKPSAPW
jgi:ER membrane protein complex subunit 2